MAQIFPEWANKAPTYLALSGVVAALLLSLGIWYYFSPEFTDVGYQPVQPIPFSHRLHAGELEMDCRYCHAMVEVSAVASVPPTQVCMNCHQLVGRDLASLDPLRDSMATQEPVRWVRVHKVPEYAYFHHAVHVNAGIGCSTCHGNVREMEKITQMKPLSMSWCLSCHRNPDPYLRPPEEITNTAWSPPPEQEEFARRVRAERNIQPSDDCTVCHR